MNKIRSNKVAPKIAVACAVLAVSLTKVMRLYRIGQYETMLPGFISGTPSIFFTIYCWISWNGYPLLLLLALIKSLFQYEHEVIPKKNLFFFIKSIKPFHSDHITPRVSLKAVKCLNEFAFRCDTHCDLQV